MNTKQLIELSLLHLGEDTDAETVTEFRPALLCALNEGYSEIIRAKIRPVAKEDVALTDGKFGMDALEKDCIGINRVLSKDGVNLPFTISGGIVDTHSLQPAATVEYAFMSPALAEDADVPVFAADKHHALADYAAYRLMGTGSRSRQIRGEFFFENYLRACTRIGEEYAPPSITNKY